MRGLKEAEQRATIDKGDVSHPSRMRGLKYEKLYKELINKLAASYMGVWIKCESSRI